MLVNKSKIKAVKNEKELTTEEKKDYELIDLSSYALLPGLIDSHTHLLYKEELHAGMDFSTLSSLKSLTMEGDAYRAIYGSVKAKKYLEAGITSVQDLGNSGKFGDIALRKAIEDGLVAGPRMRCSGPGLSSEGGQLPGIIFKHLDIINDEYRIIKGSDDAVQAVRENINQGADVIKVFSNNMPNVTALSVEEMKAIVKEAHRYGLRVTAHATNNESVYNAVIAGVDGIEHGYNMADSTLQLMAKKGIVLVPTDGDKVYFTKYNELTEPGSKTTVQDAEGLMKFYALRLQRAIKAGVTIAAGSDDYLDVKIPLGESSKHVLIGYAEAGVDISKVLQFATVNAAKQLNWSDKIGVLKKGFMADMIAVDLNVDKDIKAVMNVHFVMKDGHVYVDHLGK